MVRENDPGEAEGGGGRLLPPLPGEWPSAAAAPQPIKSGGDVGTGVQSLAVPCRALRAVPAPWGHALRAPPDHHVHPVVACQHPVKRCEQEVITPRLKVLPFPPLALSPPGGFGVPDNLQPSRPSQRMLSSAPTSSWGAEAMGNSEHSPWYGFLTDAEVR